MKRFFSFTLYFLAVVVLFTAVAFFRMAACGSACDRGVRCDGFGRCWCVE